MVWFQCDDCGENLKKPKLAGHFRCCSASRLSCIDCGAEFDQRSVQQHTQCVSETVKYGPKGGKGAQPKASAAAPKEDDEAASSMGLSARPPWSCSLCNVKATGRDTLAVHGQGKKHKAKARAAMKAQNGVKSKTEQPIEAQNKVDDTVKVEVEAEKMREETEVKKTDATEVNAEMNGEAEKSKKRKKGDGDVNAEVKKTKAAEINDAEPVNADAEKKKSKKQKVKNEAELNAEPVNAEAEKNKSKKQKKVKSEAEVNTEKMNGGAEVMNGETEKSKSKKRKKVDDGEKVAAESEDKKDAGGDKPVIGVKWRKLVGGELKAVESGRVKMKKLAMAVVPRAMEQSQTPVDEKALKVALKEYLTSSSKFEVHGKYVQRRA